MVLCEIGTCVDFAAEKRVSTVYHDVARVLEYINLRD
jgi:hypothetical protein